MEEDYAAMKLDISNNFGAEIIFKRLLIRQHMEKFEKNSH